MTREQALYRAWRLRRLIAVAALLPVLAAIAVAGGTWGGPVALVAGLLPVLHALRFPNAWAETFAVSLSVVLVLGLAATIGAGVGALGLGMRVIGLCIFGLAAFLVLAVVLPTAVTLGPGRPMTARARARSTLDPIDLQRAITLYPGREDQSVTCGAPDRDGIFEIRIHHRLPDGCTDDAPFDVTLFARVMESDPATHEIMMIEDEGEVPAMLLHTFLGEADGGCAVERAERGALLPVGLRAGFWLTDTMADHLTDDIDRAEGRPTRAIRFAGHDTLLLALARRVATGSGTATEA